MADLIFKSPQEINLKITAYNNCDDVQLCWRTLANDEKDYPIIGSLGFMIERQRQKEGQWLDTEILRNRVGFTEQPDDNNAESLSRPSSVWPFQRYDWTDHGANNGEIVRYRISAVKYVDGEIGIAELSPICVSSWTTAIEVSAKASDDISVYFNRGTVMSQYVARIAREKKWSPADIAANVKDLKEPLRLFLSGELRTAMLNILDKIIANPFLELYAALYELSDKELIAKLVLIGKRAHVVLSDGSNKGEKDGHVIYKDGNEKSRATLVAGKVDVTDRILGRLGLGHNKIMIVVDNRTDKAKSVWTGSTNWSTSGLCTQLNNGIYFEKEEIAKLYYDYWKILQASGSEFTDDLVSHNSQPKSVNNVDVWFTRTAVPQPVGNTPIDIQAIQNIVSNAKESILYVMFQPGPEPLKTIVLKDMEPNIYVRGVVSTLIPSNREKFELISDGTKRRYETDLIQPNGVNKDFGWWVKEVARREFIPNVGFAITHTKMIVVDPFSDNPTVITGSHNFSASASQSNDENFVVIKGNKKLAEHYAVTCVAMYNHYRWRAYLYDKAVNHQNPWQHLSIDPIWQNEYLKSKRLIKHLDQWC